MKQLKTEFKIGATTTEHFPNTRYSEVAFSGRSNVGKSSLLNTLVVNKKTAKISSTPGKTQQINFFLVEGHWMFVDLPGFGYAKVAKTEREKWRGLNFGYLEGREQLKLVCLLVDSRHDPMDSDIAMMEWLENHEKHFAIILTKSDKVSKTFITERVEQIRTLTANCNFLADIIPFSAVDNTGRDTLLHLIKKVM
jgi:GTP-binding protein